MPDHCTDCSCLLDNQTHVCYPPDVLPRRSCSAWAGLNPSLPKQSVTSNSNLPSHALHDTLSTTIMQQSLPTLQAAPAQKNLGPASGEVEAIQPMQAPPSRTQAVGVASQLRTAAFKLLLMGCRSSGAAFIKWGQWSATREDIFPAVSQLLAFGLYSSFFWRDG